MGNDPKPMPEVRGSAAIRIFIAKLLESAVTVHQCHTPEIDLISESSAHGIWAMEDEVQMSGFHIHGRGRYHESYVLQSGVWLIRSLHLTRTRGDVLEGDASRR